MLLSIKDSPNKVPLIKKSALISDDAFVDQPNYEELEFNILAFQLEHKDVCDWVLNNKEHNNFAKSLYNYLTTNGFLSVRQIDSVNKSIKKVELKLQLIKDQRDAEAKRKQAEEKARWERQQKALQLATERDNAIERRALQLRQQREQEEWQEQQAAHRKRQQELAEQREKERLAWEKRREAERLEREKQEAERKKAFRSTALEKIAAAFELAKLNGLKRVSLRIKQLYFYIPKKVHNFGEVENHILIRHKNKYIGKLTMDGDFFEGNYTNDEDFMALMMLKSDLKAMVTDHGKERGECACCGRELTDPRSIEMGIGPLCAERWGINVDDY